MERWTFGLPPSVGWTLGKGTQARAALAPLGCVNVRVALSYQDLLRDLVRGDLDVAWAPPRVCAQLLEAGGRVLLQAERGGATTYRSVLFARADRHLATRQLAGLRAGWMDENSMSGCILPRALLRRQGVPPSTMQERFLGSYAACVQAVLDGKVDVSATYSSAAHARRPREGFEELAAARASELVALAHTPECPNDAVVLSPVHAAQGQAWRNALQPIHAAGAARDALARALEVDGFQPAVPAAFHAMVDLLA